jgi:hypothetical protein
LAKSRSIKTGSPYRTVGKTYDGVKVLAPKTKSKTFTASEVRKAIEKALDAVSTPHDKPLRETSAIRIQQRSDGRFEVKRPGAKRASDVKDTQTEAIARAKELDPDTTPIAKRVRKRPGARKGTWRKTQ